jgi:hypothetical protein
VAIPIVDCVPDYPAHHHYDADCCHYKPRALSRSSQDSDEEWGTHAIRAVSYWASEPPPSAAPSLRSITPTRRNREWCRCARRQLRLRLSPPQRSRHTHRSAREKAYPDLARQRLGEVLGVGSHGGSASLRLAMRAWFARQAGLNVWRPRYAEKVDSIIRSYVEGEPTARTKLSPAALAATVALGGKAVTQVTRAVELPDMLLINLVKSNGA